MIEIYRFLQTLAVSPCLSRERPGRPSQLHAIPPEVEERLQLPPARGQDNSSVTSNHKCWTRPDETKPDDQFRFLPSWDRKGAWLETQFSPAPWLGCYFDHRKRPALMVPGRPHGPNHASFLKTTPLNNTSATASLHKAEQQQEFKTAFETHFIYTCIIRETKTIHGSFPKEPSPDGSAEMVPPLLLLQTFPRWIW